MTMIERVARAISKVDGRGYGYEGFTAHYNELALTAIVAMIDPTEKMVEAGRSMSDFESGVWLVMINAALAE